jgi:hypothetical protein
MKLGAFVLAVLVLSNVQLVAQTGSSAPSGSAENCSGMYTFLQDGEFVQVTVEDVGRVTGFVSRYGDGESDHGVFLDQFFKEGRLEGSQLRFLTQTVHGVWFEFRGTVSRGPGKTPDDDGYHILTGTLTESREDVNKKLTSKSQAVTFKSFPKDMGADPTRD